jgi:hypothetical protein
MKKYIFCLLIWPVLIVAGDKLYASDALTEQSSCTAKGLGNEPLLHAAGAPTADVLHRNENYVNMWGWGAYGITNNLTIIYDWLLVFAKIPAGFIRYQLPPHTDKFSYSLELFGFSLEHLDEEEVKAVETEEFEIYQSGWQAWVHLNATYRINSRLRMHVSAGSTFDTYQKYTPKENAKFSEDIIYEDYYSFDFAVGFDFLLKKNLRISTNYIKGNQLFIYDQNPQKWAIQMGIHFVPFSNWKPGFFRNMRIELYGFYVNFPELKYEEGIPPLFPLISWQWQIK